MTRPVDRGRSGFSLVELLLAMSLFGVLSVGLVALLSKASDFLAGGASQTETMDSLQSFAEQFGSDVATMASRADSETGRPDVRLYSDLAPSDVDGDGRPDVTAQRLFFVRVIPNDAAAELSRAGGLDVAAAEYLDQTDDAARARGGRLRATGALMEVFWTALPEPAPAGETTDPAVLQLWRGYRAPPGGPRSLLPVKPVRDPSALGGERGPFNLVDVRAVARPVLSGVLYFGVDFWGRRTTTWDAQVRPRDGGPYPTWDSTRGVLPQGEDGETFFLSKKATFLDQASLDDPTDDAFPRKLRVTCVVEELGRNARVGFLDAALAADAKSIPVSDTRFFPTTETAQRYVKIDAEWIEVGLPSGNVIPVVRRGVRGTVAAPHSAGSKVHHGRTFVGEYLVAAFRDTYRDELPALTGRGAVK